MAKGPQDRPAHALGVAKSHRRRHLLYRFVGRLQAGAGGLHPQVLHGLGWRHAHFPHKGPGEVARAHGRLIGQPPERGTPTLYRAKGCPRCDFQGYRGRTALMELVRMDSEYVKDWGALMSGYTIASIPMILIFLFTMRLFVKGLSSGALKG